MLNVVGCVLYGVCGVLNGVGCDMFYVGDAGYGVLCMVCGG